MARPARAPTKRVATPVTVPQARRGAVEPRSRPGHTAPPSTIGYDLTGVPPARRNLSTLPVGSRFDPAEARADEAAARVDRLMPAVLPVAGGQAGGRLSSSARRLVEPLVGADLSGVRLHTDHDAGQHARRLGARAFTVWNDVFFAPGEYRPGTRTGLGLLVHELAHASQHRRGDAPIVRRAPLDRTAEPVLGGRTNYRFDTFRTTAEDLAGEEFVIRFNGLSLPALEDYLARARDADVAEYVAQIIDVRRAEQRMVGEQIVARYMALNRRQRRPGGLCFEVARARVEQATKDIAGELTEGLTPERLSTFDRIWGSRINVAGDPNPRESWLAIPDSVRGLGAPGAMVFAGRGVLVDEAAIWAGGLQPGAVIQTWSLRSDAAKVKNGESPESYGHSFIFLRYRRRGNRPDGAIIGMDIADQGFQSGGILKRSDYEFWVGANITIPGERKFVRPRIPWRGPEAGGSRVLRPERPSLLD